MRVTIVVAEDEPFIRRSIVRKIRAVGGPFQVIGQAADAEEADRMVRELRPDVLVTDIRMPPGDGLGVARELAGRFPTLQIIVVTGYDEFEYARDALRFGVRDYLVKPVDVAQMGAALARAAEQLEYEHAQVEGRLRQDPAHDGEATCRAAVTYIGEHYRERLSVAAVAAALGYSPDHLTRLFVRHRSIHPRRYIAELRIREAVRLLRAHPEILVAQVGSLVGYSDPAHFSRVFKRLTGESPQSFRSAPPA